MITTNRTLNTTAPINWNHELNRGLRAAYQVFPHTSGGTMLWDMTRSGFDGVLTNMDPGGDWLTESGREGGYGCLDFAGTNDVVIVPDSPALDITGEMSAFCWLRVPLGHAPTENQGVIAKYQHGSGKDHQRSYSLIISQTNAYLGMAISDVGTFNAAGVLNSTTALDDGLWHHVGMSFKPSTYMRLFVDGQIVAEDTTSIVTGIFSGTADLWLGCQFNFTLPGFFLTSAMDEILLYDRGHSQDDATSLYYESISGSPRRLNWIDFGYAVDQPSEVTSPQTEIPGTATPVGDGEYLWNDTNNLLNDGGGTAETDIADAGDSDTDTLLLTNFNLDIPEGATPTGVEVVLHNVNCNGGVNASNNVLKVRLIVGGTQTGEDKGDGYVLAGTPEDLSYGGETDLWTLSLTREQVIATTYGVAIQFNQNNGDSIELDTVFMRVWFTTESGEVQSAIFFGCAF